MSYYQVSDQMLTVIAPEGLMVESQRKGRWDGEWCVCDMEWDWRLTLTLFASLKTAGFPCLLDNWRTNGYVFLMLVTATKFLKQSTEFNLIVSNTKRLGQIIS